MVKQQPARTAWPTAGLHRQLYTTWVGKLSSCVLCTNLTFTEIVLQQATKQNTTVTQCNCSRFLKVVIFLPMAALSGGDAHISELLHEVLCFCGAARS